MKLVPNTFPAIEKTSYRIAIIGEAPGQDEEREGKPFVGASGKFLSSLLSSAGITRDACFIGNVCQFRPPANNISAFSWDGVEIQHGLEQLRKDIQTYKPNICVLLGNTALRAAFPRGGSSVHLMRGSLFMPDADSVLAGFKCITSFHPASALRVYEQKPLIDFDLRRAREEGAFPELKLLERKFNLRPTVDEIELLCSTIRSQRSPISIDIEGYVTSGMTCISIATSPTEATIIPFWRGQWMAWPDVFDEIRVWKALADLLSDPAVPKILQNGLYDLFVLAYAHKIFVRSQSEDTMLKWWELYCEMEKKLSIQASLLTKEPYWKEERGSDTVEDYFRYCCKDSAVTYEICKALDNYVTGASKDHYRFNMELLRPLLYMELRGIRFNKEEAEKRLVDVLRQGFAVQHELNVEAGFPASYDQAQLLALCRLNLCEKRRAAAVVDFDTALIHSKASCYLAMRRVKEIVTTHTFPITDPSIMGELSTHLSVQGKPSLHLNVDSPAQMQDFLYTTKFFPVQYKKEKGAKTEKIACDVMALLNIYRLTQDPVVIKILKLRGLLTQAETLSVGCDKDGRVRCGYNLVGTETGRLSCYTSPTGSGFNLQTVTKKQRDLYLADEDRYFFQCDLAGADGWTIAAYCRLYGDSTMMDDYLYGLKPAKIIAAMRELGADVAKLSREELKKICKEVNQDGWVYFACKRIQHSSNYAATPPTISDIILKDSYKLTGTPIYVPPKECTILQGYYFQRYHGVKMIHAKAKTNLSEKGYYVAASGHKRVFLGRKTDHSTFKEYLAHGPQANTTYATNLAMRALWKDPENRRPDGSLIIEPLHQVHDAICGQFPRDVAPWAVKKIRSYFENPLLIASQQITIPFEGAYGRSWGELTEAI